MDQSDPEFQEYRMEVEELLSLGEDALLQVSGGDAFLTHYDAIFRTFHNIKGAAGFIDMTELQEHMHQLETYLGQCKDRGVIQKNELDMFLRGLDGARQLLDGNSIQFNYTPDLNTPKQPASAPKVLEERPVAIVSPETEPLETLTIEAPAQVNPVQAQTTPADTLDHEPSAEQRKSKILYKVLIVDDSRGALAAVAETLLSAGCFEVHTTEDPTSVVSKAQSIQPDVIISDYEMPIMSGLDVLRTIRKVDRDLPVLFLSAKVNKQMLLEALSNGIFGVLEKPFEDTHLIHQALTAARKYRLDSILARSINLLFYQYKELDDFLREQGKDETRKTIRDELKSLLQQRKNLTKAA